MIAKWYEVIVNFDFEVEYCPGVLNKLPDLLSRLYPDFVKTFVREKSRQLLQLSVRATNEEDIESLKRRPLYKCIFEFVKERFGECNMDLCAFKESKVCKKDCISMQRRKNRELSGFFTKLRWRKANLDWHTREIVGRNSRESSFRQSLRSCCNGIRRKNTMVWEDVTPLHEQPIVIERHSKLYFAQKLATSELRNNTQWRWLLVWPVSAKQKTHHVSVDGNVANWERYALNAESQRFI